MHEHVDRPTCKTCRQPSGFTLIELMIVVAIVAILAAIAYPSYQGHVIRTRRAAAAVCMLEVAQFMERYYTTHLRYVDDAGAAPTIPATQCRTDLQSHYTIGLADGTVVGAYSVQAVPKGVQAIRDTKCVTLAINQLGAKSESGTAATATECF
ncbi:prepilin-type N-terminal cleavage/methylation domain-containing protein [Lysobacter arenosi]|uniref:Prepilin-type N-terminal cleavage/methylation domain-containing protein n=1 Tax=Lysobacter arenosi TaxID=2795387 RepID=A0ABX7RGB7_9GAMM|nr:type IV pilin protein [Lysobacter arenosi]QSX75987.1 prepilin-type N-terminal cleavage/methylation domain-containing protein [Lysobacter arenosi]